MFERGTVVAVKNARASSKLFFKLIFESDCGIDFMKIIKTFKLRNLSPAVLATVAFAFSGGAAQIYAHGGEDHGTAKPKTETTDKGTVLHTMRVGDLEVMLKHQLLLPDAAATARLFVTEFETNEAAADVAPAIEIEAANGAVTSATVEKAETAGSFTVKIPALAAGTYSVRAKLTHGGETDTATFSGLSVENAAAENRAANTNGAANSRVNNAPHSNPAGDETPSQVKAAFPDAQSFTTQHKDVAADKIAEIEKTTGGKVPEKDHHSYLAFSTVGGKRTQIGAATVIKAGGKDIVVIYENKNGSPAIKEVRADGVAKEFLAQFAGKGHDDKLQIGADLKANGADEAAAKAIADAVRVDQATMQSLYGSAHDH